MAITIRRKTSGNRRHWLHWSGQPVRRQRPHIQRKRSGDFGTVMANWLSALEGPFNAVLSGTETRMNRRRMQILYSGRVQGVGFRYQAQRAAAGYEVTGTVRNLPDGRVELVAEGDVEELKAFRQALRDCGLSPLIDHEEDHWTEARGGIRGFEIVR